MKSNPLVLLILDGFGVRTDATYNAIAQADTPCWDDLLVKHPHTTLKCSGHTVGLPEGQMGNSEVGHMHIGAGRYIPQDFSQVSDAIESGEFFHNKVLCAAIDNALTNNSYLHLLALVSEGGVHSHIDHLIAMIELAAKKGLSKIKVHAFLDGRDVPPKSAAQSLTRVAAKLTELEAGHIASIVGRFYAMDRDNRWDRIAKAHQLIVHGKANYQADSALDALNMAYQRGESDEFVEPTLIADTAPLADADSVVFMNFRADRAREISQAITATDFTHFTRHHAGFQGHFSTLTSYHENFSYPVAYQSMEIKNSLGAVLAQHGLTQLRLAETEKYAHVTFFMNGGIDEPNKGEARILVPSPSVKTYDLQPEMHAQKVTEHLVNAITEQQYDVIICNYANCDMVGHTGNWAAALKAVTTIDQSLAQIVNAIEQVHGQLFITADHGNIEQMQDDNGGQFTAHTTNPVPLVYIGGTKLLKSGGSLKDLAPTILACLNLAQPCEMNGQSLLISD